jgi:outer membrane protein assembly factor BamB
VSRRRLLVLGSIAAVVLVAGGVVAYVVAKRLESRDVTGSSTKEFVTTAAPKPKPPKAPGIAWPTYGYDAQRDHISPYAHRPPYRRLWSFSGRSLLEFPPAVAYGRLYITNNGGFTFAVDVETGKRVWRHASGRCAASSPAVARGIVVQAFLNRPPCNRRSASGIEGAVIAYAQETGKVLWRTRIGPSESSPVVVGATVYVGDWTGDVHALALRTGAKRWTYRTGGQVKGAVAVSGNRLFVGSYDGRVYALNARTGALQWSSGSQDRLGGRGRFYSTPAIAYGRVYIGSTDGKVYAFGAASGDLLWSHSTGGYVYSSPAVAERLVFAGSYSGRFYALDAATGEERWSFSAGASISGSATVMDRLVYFATLGERTYALQLRTGRRVWSFPDGKYTPVVADRERVYLVGHARVHALVPRAG